MRKPARILIVLLAALSLLVCAACGDRSAGEPSPSQATEPSPSPTSSPSPSNSPSPSPAPPEPSPSEPEFPPTREDLGGGYTLVTDFDEQGRKLLETTLYSGEIPPAKVPVDFDPETGELVPIGSTEPEVVEDKVMSRTVYDYDGEGYQMQERTYRSGDPDPNIPYLVRWEDAEGRTILYEQHNFHLDWGTTEDFCRYTMDYEENAPDVAVTIQTSFVPGTFPNTKPVTGTARCTVPLSATAHGVVPAGISYGKEGVLSFSLCEVDKEGKSLRTYDYDGKGNLGSSYEAMPSEPQVSAS